MRLQPSRLNVGFQSFRSLKRKGLLSTHSGHCSWLPRAYPFENAECRLSTSNTYNLRGYCSASVYSLHPQRQPLTL